MAQHLDRTVWLTEEGSPEPTRACTLGIAFTSGRAHVIREANEAFRRFTGELHEAIVGRSLLSLLEPSDERDEIRRLLDQVFVTRIPEFRTDIARPPLSPASDLRRYFTLVASPVVSGTGERGLQVQVLDTSVQAQVREAKDEVVQDTRLANESLLLAGLREQELAELAQREAERWSALVANLTEGVTVLDGGGRPILINPIGRRLLAIDDGPLPDEYVVGSLETLAGGPVPPEQHPARRALAGERFTEQELCFLGPGGERRRLVFAGSAVHDDAGKVVLAINVYRDVTELRHLEQTREDYVALISHDLRNPLQALLGHAQLLLRYEQQSVQDPSEQPSRIFRSAAAIFKVTRRLQGMVEDLYQSAQLESGSVVLCRERVSLVELVADLRERVGTVDDRARLRISAAPDLPCVRIDAARMERALVNLITNALKYSAPGTEVRLELARTKDEVVLAVRDQGPGISAADVPFLFEKYRRAKRTAQRDGLGLGLYITRRIVEAHGGTVDVESAVGRGSTFRIVLPIDAPSDGDEKPAST
jgi:signal transduction histidine kinase